MQDDFAISILRRKYHQELLSEFISLHFPSTFLCKAGRRSESSGKCIFGMFYSTRCERHEVMLICGLSGRVELLVQASE